MLSVPAGRYNDFQRETLKTSRGGWVNIGARPALSKRFPGSPTASTLGALTTKMTNCIGVPTPKRNARICLLPRMWTVKMQAARGCSSHRHLPPRKIEAMVKAGDAVWLNARTARYTRLGKLPFARMRDISGKVGEELAHAIRRREGWALAMYASIRGQRENGLQSTRTASGRDILGGAE